LYEYNNAVIWLLLEIEAIENLLPYFMEKLPSTLFNVKAISPKNNSVKIAVSGLRINRNNTIENKSRNSAIPVKKLPNTPITRLFTPSVTA
jgi:hypothetical protein